MRPELKLILLFSFCFLTSLQAQKTVTFNGKLYLVYPQTISSYRHELSFYESYHSISGILFPPIIGNVKDGEYLLYTQGYNLIRKGKGQYDTVYQVYGTFSIRDNKKEGKAFIYQAGVKQGRVLAMIPYKNDLIDGEVQFEAAKFKSFKRKHKKRFRRKKIAYDSDYDFEGGFYSSDKKDKALDYKAIFYRIDYREGVMDGLTRNYFLVGKDTLLSASYSMSRGKKHGKFSKITYYMRKKKVLRNGEEQGFYLNDKKNGEWTQQFNRGKYTIKQLFHNDTMTHEKSVSFEGTIFSMKSYGEDSIAKYVPDYKSRKMIPYPEYSENDLRTGNFIEFRYLGDSVEYAYAVDHYASENFFSDRYRNEKFFSWAEGRDTLISGRLFRLMKYSSMPYTSVKSDQEYAEMMYAIDTCWDYIGLLSQIDFCQEVLWIKTYDKKTGVLKRYYKTEAFDRYDFTDSLKPVLRETFKREFSVHETYYQAALNYRYTNETFTSGPSKGCKLYYKVSGGYRTGSIIRCIHIPSSYDTITLMDTIMAAGKYLREDYSYFTQGYENLVHGGNNDYAEEEELRAVYEENFNRELSGFFSLAPIQHKTVLLGGKLFTGSLELRLTYEKKPRVAKARVYEIHSLFDFIRKKLAIEISLEMNANHLLVRGGAFIVPSVSQNYELEGGLLNGSVEFKDLFDNVSVATYYMDNHMSSRLYCEAHRMNLEKKKDEMYSDDDYTLRKIVREGLYKVQAPSMQFDNGLKEGQWMMVNDKGMLTEQLTFHKGNRHGLQMLFEHDEVFPYLQYMYHMVNDTVNGEVWSLRPDGYPRYRGYFEMGVPHGVFTAYFQGDTDRFFNQQFRFDHGFLTGNYLEYRDSNNLALSVVLRKEDSMHYDAFEEYNYWVNSTVHRLYRPSNSGQGFINNLFDISLEVEYEGYEEYDEYGASGLKKGLYSYYYQSQTVFSRGAKEYNKPVGLWLFYREGKDRIYKKMDFRDSFVLAGKDTVKTFGLVKAYYDDGRLMFTGYATDRSSAYSCESGADMPVEEDYYIEFYDTAGKPLLQNGNGMIRELQANGYVLKEGRVENYLKQGIWVYYSKFGLPQSIGVYKDGKKTGRWLSGDLGGLNLDERICYMSDEEFKSWINMFGGNLDLEEEFYVDGELISSQRVNTFKR